MALGNGLPMPVDMDETANMTNVTADTSTSTVMTVHKAFDPNAISDSEDDTSGNEEPAAKKKRTRLKKYLSFCNFFNINTFKILIKLKLKILY
ncbi:hypothetical protein BpHYR1_035845 [Brachionus plicatilis]|uniref:Uncharacterized protein n=1 Tax=Brachionus plicatilis TaxID=10195 RepID=A0A3M7PIB0_BRAPC|nr:hypothetical protein BpHYR1_035845 [Brachionus plicatilis]